MDKLIADLASNSPMYAILIWALVAFLRGRIHSDPEFQAMRQRAETAEERTYALLQTARRAVTVSEKAVNGGHTKPAKRKPQRGGRRR